MSWRLGKLTSRLSLFFFWVYSYGHFEREVSKASGLKPMYKCRGGSCSKGHAQFINTDINPSDVPAMAEKDKAYLFIDLRGRVVEYRPCCR